MTLEDFKREHQHEMVVFAEDLQPLMNISPDKIREYARRGEFPIQSFPSGKRVKFVKEDVIRYFEGQKKTGPQATINLNFTGDTLEEVVGKMQQFLQMCRIA